MRSEQANYESISWLNLLFTTGIGQKVVQNILSRELQPNDVYQLDDADLKQLGMTQPAIKAFRTQSPNQPSEIVEKTLNWAERPANHLITICDDRYPAHLKNIHTPPPFLMVKGNLQALHLPQVAIVGSRYPSPSGEQQAFDFAEQLTHLGLAVTSGLARGIDAAAHNGALQARGTTIAVLGTGLNQIYPRQHKQLSEQIIEKGALVSEFGLEVQAFKGNFPKRNRVVSGLSLGTLVVEATLNSGSLITARQALEQNREVFAIPGAIHNPQKAGCHHLIRQGAVLVESAEQIMTELGYQIAPITEKVAVPLELDLDPLQYKIVMALGYDGIDMDDLVNKTQLSVAQLSVALMDLELSGIVTQASGQYLRR